MSPTPNVLPVLDRSSTLEGDIDLRSGAAHLISRIENASLPHETQELITYALNMVADAEHKISEQRDRISKLEDLVMTDELTRLYNRRGFQDHFDRAIAAARRSITASGVFVMIDLDDFKYVNDTFGHAAGDCYLKAVSDFLVNEVRSTDVIARLGGDEFALILTRTDAENGLKRTDEILSKLNELKVDYKGLKIPVKASHGSFVYTGEKTAEEVFEAADHKLYSTKKKRKKLA